MAAKTYQELDASLTRILHAYKQAVEKSGVPVEQMLLFGSRAKGTAHPDSDIDVAVISPAFGKDRHDERVALMHLRDDISTFIEPHPFHPDELADPWSTLAHEVTAYGIEIQ